MSKKKGPKKTRPSDTFMMSQSAGNEKLQNVLRLYAGSVSKVDALKSIDTEELPKDIHELQMHLADSMQEVAAMKGKLHYELSNRYELEKQNEDLTSKLAKTRNSLEQAGKAMQEVQHATSVLLAKKESYQADYDAMEDENSSLKSKIAALESQMESESIKYKKLIAEKTNNVQYMEVELMQMRFQLSQKTIEAADVLKTREDLENSLAVERQRGAELLEMVKDLTSKNETSQNRILELQEKLHESFVNNMQDQRSVESPKLGGSITSSSSPLKDDQLDLETSKDNPNDMDSVSEDSSAENEKVENDEEDEYTNQNGADSKCNGDKEKRISMRSTSTDSSLMPEDMENISIQLETSMTKTLFDSLDGASVTSTDDLQLRKISSGIILIESSVEEESKFTSTVQVHVSCQTSPLKGRPVFKEVETQVSLLDESSSEINFSKEADLPIPSQVETVSSRHTERPGSSHRPLTKDAIPYPSRLDAGSELSTGSAYAEKGSPVRYSDLESGSESAPRDLVTLPDYLSDDFEIDPEPRGVRVRKRVDSEPKEALAPVVEQTSLVSEMTTQSPVPIRDTIPSSTTVEQPVAPEDEDKIFDERLKLLEQQLNLQSAGRMSVELDPDSEEQSVQSLSPEHGIWQPTQNDRQAYYQHMNQPAEQYLNPYFQHQGQPMTPASAGQMFPPINMYHNGSPSVNSNSIFNVNDFNPNGSLQSLTSDSFKYYNQFNGSNEFLPVLYQNQSGMGNSGVPSRASRMNSSQGDQWFLNYSQEDVNTRIARQLLQQQERLEQSILRQEEQQRKFLEKLQSKEQGSPRAKPRPPPSPRQTDSPSLNLAHRQVSMEEITNGLFSDDLNLSTDRMKVRSASDRRISPWVESSKSTEQEQTQDSIGFSFDENTSSKAFVAVDEPARVAHRQLSFEEASLKLFTEPIVSAMNSEEMFKLEDKKLEEVVDAGDLFSSVDEDIQVESEDKLITSVDKNIQVESEDKLISSVDKDIQVESEDKVIENREKRTMTDGSMGFSNNEKEVEEEEEQPMDREKMQLERKELKQSILQWSRDFVGTHRREPTAKEREEQVGAVYQKYRKLCKILKPDGLSSKSFRFNSINFSAPFDLDSPAIQSSNFSRKSIKVTEEQAKHTDFIKSMSQKKIKAIKLDESETEPEPEPVKAEAAVQPFTDFIKPEPEPVKPEVAEIKSEPEAIKEKVKLEQPSVIKSESVPSNPVVEKVKKEPVVTKPVTKSVGEKIKTERVAAVKPAVEKIKSEPVVAKPTQENITREPVVATHVVEVIKPEPAKPAVEMIKQKPEPDANSVINEIEPEPISIKSVVARNKEPEVTSEIEPEPQPLSEEESLAVAKTAAVVEKVKLRISSPKSPKLSEKSLRVTSSSSPPPSSPSMSGIDMDLVLQEKNQLKRNIHDWAKEFAVKYNREPTKKDREQYAGDMYKRYKQYTKVLSSISGESKKSRKKTRSISNSSSSFSENPEGESTKAPFDSFAEKTNENTGESTDKKQEIPFDTSPKITTKSKKTEIQPALPSVKEDSSSDQVINSQKNPTQPSETVVASVVEKFVEPIESNSDDREVKETTKRRRTVSFSTQDEEKTIEAPTVKEKEVKEEIIDKNTKNSVPEKQGEPERIMSPQPIQPSQMKFESEDELNEDTDNDEKRAGGSLDLVKLQEEKKKIKRVIREWTEKFVEENKREPTNTDRESHVPDLFRKYRHTTKILRENDIFSGKYTGSSSKTFTRKFNEDLLEE